MLADQRNETFAYPLCHLIRIVDSFVATHSGPIVSAMSFLPGSMTSIGLRYLIAAFLKPGGLGT